MFSMGLTLTTEDFKILAQRPFDICVGCDRPVSDHAISGIRTDKAFEPSGRNRTWPDSGRMLSRRSVIQYHVLSVRRGCGIFCWNDNGFHDPFTSDDTILVSFLASGTHISIKALPMLVSIVETVILPVALGFLLNYLFGKKKTFGELQKIMPGIAVLGLACVVGGVVSSQGAKFFESGVVIFVAVFLHNGLGYLLGYGAGRLVGMNTAKKRTIAIEVGMQNAGLATNLATTTAQFASTPESAIICAVSCTWHSISGTLLAGMFAFYDKCKQK